MRKLSLLPLVVCFSSSCVMETTPIEISENEVAYQLEAIGSAVANTPYSALVRHISVEILDLPDDDQSDDYVEQQHVYHADVIETYRGEPKSTISYTMFVENGESATVLDEPFIITLCDSTEGFYWPGTGANFSADRKMRDIAEEVSKSTDKDQVVFGDCE